MGEMSIEDALHAIESALECHAGPKCPCRQHARAAVLFIRYLSEAAQPLTPEVSE